MAPDIDERDMSDPTDVASEADDSVRRTHERGRRRREPCSPFVDEVRGMLVLERGTWGIGGRRWGRTGGMRDARGGWGKRRPPEGVGGRALLPLPREEEGEENRAVVGSGTPRMCTMPAPSRVSSSVHGFDVVDAMDMARATAGVAAAPCCQS